MTTKETLQQIYQVILVFLKNPVEGIKALPNWDWPTLLILQAALGFTFNVLAAILAMNLYAFLFGLFLAPIFAIVFAGLTTLFLYYAFLLLQQIQLPLKTLFTLTVFSTIPLFILQTLSGLFPPITLLGFAISAYIGYHGLIANFQLSQNVVKKIVGSLAIVFVLIWLVDKIDLYTR